MKQTAKTIIRTLGIIAFFISASFAQKGWVPIVMDDIVTFVSGDIVTTVQTNKKVYLANENITVHFSGMSGDTKDWIGLYRHGAGNDWGNVLDWQWTGGRVEGSMLFDGLAKGEYDVRAFFKNGFDVQASTSIKVMQERLTPGKQTYASDETVSVTVAGSLSGVEDWVGIYPKGSNNDWENVIAWNWVKYDGSIVLDSKRKAMPAGEYEVRLFFHNESGANAVVRAASTFYVNGHNYPYGSKGIYEVEIDDSSDKFVVYKPKNHIQNAPVMLFFGMLYAIGNRDADNHKTSLRSEGVMRYLASLGCYIIGNKISTGGWTDATKWPNYTQALKQAKNNGADTDKLGIIGHSAGGMASYYWMKQYRSAGYGGTKSMIIDLHGYYAASMHRNDLQGLQGVDSLIIAYGGYNGNANQTTHLGDPDFSQNPRVLLTLSHLLPDTIHKGFIVLQTRDHAYSYGEWDKTIINGNTYEALKTKRDLLEPIDAMVKYEFFNDAGAYESATSILFDGYAQTVRQVDEATQSFLDNGGHYRYDCDTWMGIDYCREYQ